MKKGIITTFYKAHNYGAMLQAFALKKVLENNNCSIEFLNYKDENIEGIYKVFSLKNKSLKNKIKEVLRFFIFYKKIKKRYSNFSNFQNKYLKETKLVIDKNTKLDDVSLDVDFIITGSDQVWNKNITNELSDIYTLNFAKKNIRRISYAASIGNKKIDNELEYKNKLAIIDKISVREETAKKILDEILPEKNITTVLDPTLLLDNNEWNKYLDNSISKKEKYILAYVVEPDSEYIKVVNDLSEKTGLKVVHFEKRNKYKNELESAFTEGPLGFVNLIKNAEYIVTTSFHATVFSIIFNKKFWVVPHRVTGSRVIDLLSKLKISDRAVYSLNEFQKNKFDKEIDFNEVNNILNLEREKSINWLLNAINDEKEEKNE